MITMERAGEIIAEELPPWEVKIVFYHDRPYLAALHWMEPAKLSTEDMFRGQCREWAEEIFEAGEDEWAQDIFEEGEE